MRILAFSDLHGDASTLKLLKNRIMGESYDFILVAGDLTNADLISPTERVKQVKEIFSIMETFRIPYYYVWGIPNREGILSFALEDYEPKAAEEKGILKKELGTASWIMAISQKRNQLFKETEDFLGSLKYGKHLKEQELVKIGEYWLTSSPEKIIENTIFLKHHYRKITPKALIQLDGHIHDGQHVLNYLNLGFLYRDGVHGAPPMIGGYWNLALEGSKVSADFINLGGKLKEFVCPNRPEQGTFFVPFYWKKCPVCYSQEKALIKN